jgi:glycosyltransferase involved in cell wall biosynthesis
MKISVIMASFLGAYNGREASEKRNKQFIRAVKSFLNQSHQDKELIIVADGCHITYELYKQNFSNEPSINCFIIPKQETFSGVVRNEGLKQATGDIIVYLDNDDTYGKEHLKIIADNFEPEKYDWVYYDDYLVITPDFKKLQKRNVETRFASIGTSSISHKNLPELYITNLFSNSYGHDFYAVLKLALRGLKFKKLDKPSQYLVCHYAGVDI